MNGPVRLATVAALAIAPMAARAGPAACAKLSDLVSPAAFARFPVAPPGPAAWRGPDVRRGEAHRYRTVLREGVTGAPDFAGRYTIVRFGCGAGMACPAIVDRVIGRVQFPPAIRSIYGLPANTEPAGGFDRLAYRANSRLLVVLGARNEDERTMGATAYEWRAGRLRPLRFVPEPLLCRSGRDYR